MKAQFVADEKRFLIDSGMMGGESIYVNDNLVSQKKNFLSARSIHSFIFDGIQYEMILNANFFMMTLKVQLVKNGVALCEETFAYSGKAIGAIQTPKWSYFFIVLCGIIPFITLGGAIPVVIGLGGASGCFKVARKVTMSNVARVGACVAITFGCWLALVVFYVIMANLKAGTQGT